jgi:hypothetical protein
MTQHFSSENADSLLFTNTEISAGSMPSFHSSLGQSSTEFQVSFPTNNPLSDDFIPEQFITFKSVSEEFPSTKPFLEQILPEQLESQQFIFSKTVSEQFLPNKSVSDQFMPEKLVSQQFVPEKLGPEQFITSKPVSELFKPEQFLTQPLVPDQNVFEQFQQNIPILEQFMTEKTVSQQFVPAPKFKTEFSTDKSSMNFESSTSSPSLNVLHAIHTLHGTDESEMHLGQNEQHVLQHEPVQQLSITSMRIPGKQFQFSCIFLQIKKLMNTRQPNSTCSPNKKTMPKVDNTDTVPYR